MLVPYLPDPIAAVHWPIARAGSGEKPLIVKPAIGAAQLAGQLDALLLVQMFPRVSGKPAIVLVFEGFVEQVVKSIAYMGSILLFVFQCVGLGHLVAT
jgi:hypothetical protein